MTAHIQPSEGLALSVLAPIMYVAPFYCAGMAKASRDELRTVLFRCGGVTVACVVCILLVHFYPRMPPCAIHQWLGLSVSAYSIALPVQLLFGVYFQTLCLDIASGAKAIPYKNAARHVVIRDLIMAPVSEEVVFRGYICWVLVSAGFSNVALSSIAPLFFGGAHLHHLWQKIGIQKQPIKRACVQQLAQFAYTTLFGVIACLLFLHTGSLASPLVLHVGCNWLGLPIVSSKLLNEHPVLRAVWAVCVTAGVGTAVVHMAVQPHSLGLQC